MKDSAKIYLGLATVWPFIYLVIIILWGLRLLPFISRDAMLYIHLATWAVIMLMLGNYFIYVMNNPKLDPEQKVHWYLLLFLGSIFAMPFYWYLFIWKSPKTVK